MKSFLPQLEEADKVLQERLQGDGHGAGLDIEEVEEGEACIQMVNLARYFQNSQLVAV